jgi:small subunit ribosomal protein S6
MFILRPDLPEDQTAKIVEGISGEITKAGGTIAESTLSPKQRLAYRVRKHDDGYCLIVRFQIEQAAVEGLDKRLRMRQDLLRHMIVVYTPPAARPVAPTVPAPDSEPVKTA